MLNLRFATILLASLVLSVPAWPTTPADFFQAARTGDLAGVRRTVSSGLSVDSRDRYGTSALAMAASNGHVEIVRFLLDKGADPNTKDAFYGGSPLGSMLFMSSAAPAEALEIQKLLLAHGAEDRELAFQIAVQQDQLELARAAVDSGPFVASALAAISARASTFSEPFQELLERVESRPDPPVPDYSIAELKRFTGVFEGFDSAARVAVSVAGETLSASIDGGERQPLTVVGERSFESSDGDLSATFFGRAGTIEGIQLALADAPPANLRRSVAEPVGARAFTGKVAASVVPAGNTVNWPGFRGPAASGVGDGVDAPVEWDISSGKGVVWKVPIPGLGNSSPVVWGDRVYVTTAVAQGLDQEIRTGLTGSGDAVDESVEHRWMVVSLDKATGETLWSAEVGRAVPLTKRHFKATQANSTPVTNGRHLVVVFPTAGLACFDVDGKLLWKKELGGLNAGAFTDPGIEWGYASSPLLYGSTVILQVDVHGGQYIAAWDLDTGRQVWRTEREVAPSWATPNILSGPNGDELIVNGSTIHGYDPKTGKELWSLAPNSELVIATPVIGHGVAFVSAGYPPVKPIYAIEPGLRGELSVDPRAGDDRLVWSHGIGGAYMPTPLFYRDILYVVHHNGRLVAYDAATGVAIYKSRFSKGGTFTGSPVAVNGKLYMGTEEGRLYVVAAGPEYQELAVNEMDEPLMATPAVSEGRLFLRTPTHLIAIGAPAQVADAR